MKQGSYTRSRLPDSALVIDIRNEQNSAEKKYAARAHTRDEVYASQLTL